MKLTSSPLRRAVELFLVANGVVVFHIGLYLAFGLPAVFISVGLLSIAGGFLIDLENE